MRIIRATLVSTLLLIGSIANSALADDKAVVQTFYDFLSRVADQEPSSLARILAGSPNPHTPLENFFSRKNI